jgi:Gpi18-like mannosyltransferase
MQHDKYYQKFLIFLGAVLLLRVALSFVIFNGDVLNHIAWGTSMAKLGLIGFYNRDFTPWAAANYPPISTLLFYLGQLAYGNLFHDNTSTLLQAFFYKLPSILADIGAAYLICHICKQSKNQRWPFYASAIFLFNPALMINSVFWGQIEALMTFFCLLSIAFVYSRRKSLSFVSTTIALLVKQSALFFLPIAFALAVKKLKIRDWFLGLAISFLVFVLSYILFTGKLTFAYPFIFYLKTAGGQAHQHQITVNAYNFWYVFKLNLVSDQVSLWFASYRSLGAIITAALGLPVLISLYLKPSVGRSLYATSLIALIVFLFLTRMHERHLYPALVFIVPLLRDPKRFAAYFMLSVAHFFNLYFVWFGTPKFLMSPEMIGQTLGVISVLAFVVLYADYFSKSSNFENSVGS